jgi:hypothetical protein
MTVTREELHLRRVECRGFRRSDGLFDVEGRVTDTKSYVYPNGDRGDIPVGEPVHDMTLLLTVDTDLLIHNAVATMHFTPYKVCHGASDDVSVLVGMRIGSGWLNEVRKQWTTKDRCTHLFEMLNPMATTAYQTLSVVRGKPGQNPARINSCYAYSDTRDLVKQRWPERYIGEPRR